MDHLHLNARRLTAALVTLTLAFPGSAYAQVLVDGTELQEGSNDVGGGVATYGGGALGMENVTANDVSVDEDLSVSFDGNNSIDSFQVKGDANVTVGFNGENSVEDIEAYDNSNVTVNMDSDNELEDLEAHDKASLTVNVKGETSCEAVKGYDDANITVSGTTCPRADILKVGDDEASQRVSTDRGDLVVRDLTLVMDAEQAEVGSHNGNASIFCSKIKGGDDNERTDILAGGALFVGGSVIDVAGTMHANGELTIRRSDVDVTKPDDDDNPYRVWSKTGITLIEELNGEVKDGKIGDDDVKYLKTDDDDESEKVHLVSALKPCYYTKCDTDDESDTERAKRLPATPDTSVSALSTLVLGCGTLLAGLGLRRRRDA